jgi:hypothetical protein
MDATASGMHATADSIGQRLNRTVDAVQRGEALLLDVAVDVSSHVSRLLQLSALISSLPELPELADLRSEANSVLGAFSDALHLPHLEAVAAPTLERWYADAALGPLAAPRVPGPPAPLTARCLALRAFPPCARVGRSSSSWARR